ncbi:hypothetical protein [Amycolatopsis samaneae]|uniref:Uncharacterized protein n=1 Tax=Amycolatopsis samaneae TaxID=664691 RepID=A0ABW5GQX3_9PSEU
MLSVSVVRNAKPQAWRDAADDATQTAQHCRDVASGARYVAYTLTQAWPDDAGKQARQRFVQHAADYEIAGTVLAKLVTVYDAFAGHIDDAQQMLNSALDYARQNELTVGDDGKVTGKAEKGPEIRTAGQLVAGALNYATTWDQTTANWLRTIGSLTAETDPEVVNLRLEHGGDSASDIANRLKNRPDDVHELDIPPELLDEVRRIAKETGISEGLLTAILWQEEQWYQNWEKDGGLVTEFGHILNEEAQGLKPDKSLGITHMKLDAAREVISKNPAAFTENGKYLGDLADLDLMQRIEKDRNLDVKLSGYYLAELRKNPYGAETDKQLFILYSTGDDPATRANNHRYGDATEPRQNDILPRARNWDRLQPRLADAADWASLSSAERQRALSGAADQTHVGEKVDLHPVYGSDTTADGRKNYPRPGAPR